MGYDSTRNRYSYEGPVKEFGKVICDNWYGSTYATSEQQARNNLTYQFKSQYNRAPNSKITLSGKIERVS